MEANTLISEAQEHQAPEGMLYHYTDQNGLFGILQTGSIWATHYRFLNDSTERQEISALLSRFEEKALNDHSLSPRYLNGLRKSLAMTIELFDAYFVSFSGETGGPTHAGDRLSQWRGYSLNRCGFSLGFQWGSAKAYADNLTKTMRVGAFIWPCIYDADTKSDMAKTFTDTHIETMRMLKQEWVGKHGPDYPDEKLISSPAFINELRSLQVKILELSARFKHAGFREESEWRLVCLMLNSDPRTELIQFREGLFGRTPYIQVPLGLKQSNSPLKRIVVGPSRSKDQIVVSLKLELANMGIEGVEVIPSEIPYRNW